MRGAGSRNYEHPGLVVSSVGRTQRNGVSELVIDGFQGTKHASNGFMMIYHFTMSHACFKLNVS